LQKLNNLILGVAVIQDKFLAILPAGFHWDNLLITGIEFLKKLEVD